MHKGAKRKKVGINRPMVSQMMQKMQKWSKNEEPLDNMLRQGEGLFTDSKKGINWAIIGQTRHKPDINPTNDLIMKRQEKERIIF